MIPDLEKVKRILKNNSKGSVEQLAEQLFPSSRPPHIHCKALSIMYHEQMLSAELLKVIANREDEVSEYLKHLNRNDIRVGDRSKQGTSYAKGDILAV